MKDLKKITYNQTGRPDEDIDQIVEKFRKNHPRFVSLNKHFEGVIIKARQNEKSQTFWVDKDPFFEEMKNQVKLAKSIKIINDTEIFCVPQVYPRIPTIGLGILIVKDNPGEPKTVRTEIFEALVREMNTLANGHNISFNRTEYVLPSGKIKPNWWTIPVINLPAVIVRLNPIFLSYEDHGILHPFIGAGREVSNFVCSHLGPRFFDSWM